MPPLLQNRVQHHPSPLVLPVPTAFAVLAVVSFEGTLRNVFPVASRPMNYLVLLMYNTSSTASCACALSITVL